MPNLTEQAFQTPEQLGGYGLPLYENHWSAFMELLLLEAMEMYIYKYAGSDQRIGPQSHLILTLPFRLSRLGTIIFVYTVTTLRKINSNSSGMITDSLC